MALQAPGSPRLLAGIFLIAGLVIGYLGGRHGQTGRPAGPADPRADDQAESPKQQQIAAVPSEALPENNAATLSALARLRQLAKNGPPYDLELALRLARELTPAADCNEAMGLFSGWPSEERQVVQRGIARRWARLDPDGALNAGLRGRDDVNRTLVEEAARELARRDPEAAFARISAPLPAMQRLMLGRYLLPLLVEKDAARVAAFLGANKEFSVDDNIFVSVARAWARTDPKAALAWAADLPKGRGREAREAIWLTWGAQDPATVAAELAAAPDLKLHWKVYQTVAQTWSRTDPRALIEWIAKLPPAQAGGAWNGVSLDVRQLGADAVLELIPTIKSSSDRARVVSEIARQLTADNLAAGIAWAERLPAGELRNQALRPAIEQWSATAPAEALAYVSKLESSQVRSALYRIAMDNWATQDMEAAIAWTRQMTAGADRDALIGGALQHMQAWDPAQATRWMDLTTSPDTRERYTREIAESWAHVDPTAAAQWLGRLTDSAQQTSAYYQVARQWTFGDGQAAAGWLSALPAGAARDSAIGGYVSAMDGENPGLATAWAATISDPKMRDENVVSAFNRWLRSDSPQANAWLAAAKLPDATRTELLKAATNR